MMLAATILMAAWTTPPTASPRSPEDYARVVQQATEAMNAKDYAAAASAWAEASAIHPERPELAYNLGVARFRQGDHAGATESFKQAVSLSSGQLRNEALFNMGTSAYANALETLQKSQSEQQSPAPSSPSDGDASNPVETAKANLGEAIEQLTRAAAANPNNQDARINGELAHRLLKMLEQLESQQNQNQQNQDQQNQQNQKPQDQQNQDQQEQNSTEQQKQDQGNQNKDNQNQDNKQPQDQDRNQNGESNQQQDSTAEDSSESKPAENQKPQSAEDQKKPDKSGDAEKSPTDAAAGSDAKENPLSKEEVARILQAVRDKQRKRQEMLAQQEAEKRSRSPRTPARDW